MESFDKWPIVYEDAPLEIRRDPMGMQEEIRRDPMGMQEEIRRDPMGMQDYGLMIKLTGNYLDLPRGTIPDIVNLPVEESNMLIMRVIERQHSSLERFFRSTTLDPLYLNAVICRAYIKEERRRQTL